MTTPTKTQWDCIRENLGEWQGSFTKFSPRGEQLADVPSRLVLQEDGENYIQLTLTRHPADEPPNEMVRRFGKPGPGPLVPFLETGAFSQGSTYWSTVSQAGAELALTTPERRLRFVLLFSGLGQGRSNFNEITLIRERRAGSNAVESPKLTVEQLIGTWQGSSISHFPDGRISDPMASELTLQREGNALQQSLRFGQRELCSTGQINGDVIQFDSGPQPVQISLLPGGGSVNCPLQTEPNQAFFLEVGWLIDATHRQRLIRRYDEKGNWESLTLVREEKVG